MHRQIVYKVELYKVSPAEPGEPVSWHTSLGEAQECIDAMRASTGVGGDILRLKLDARDVVERLNEAAS